MRDALQQREDDPARRSPAFDDLQVLLEGDQLLEPRLEVRAVDLAAVRQHEDTRLGGPTKQPHEQLAANGMVATVDDPALGTTTQIGVPIHLKGTPGAIRGPRPEPGQHNEEIFGALGYAPEAMKAFT